MTVPALPFLRLPPFPGRKVGSLSLPGGTLPSDADCLALARQAAAERVGGTFWGGQPPLPDGPIIVLAPASRQQAAVMLAGAPASRCVLIGRHGRAEGALRLSGPLDPWHLLARAERVECDGADELALVAVLAGVPLRVHGAGPFAALAEPGLSREEALLRAGRMLALPGWRDPFTGQATTAAAIVGLLGEWRRLIDANRGAAAILGVARWKRVTMDALLWDGSGRPRHASPGDATARRLHRGDRVLAWHARTSKPFLARLAQDGIAVGEIEDGMIRSTGLGANCVPPLSVIVDFAGAHFDPRQASGLERILEHDAIGPAVVARAAALRHRLVAEGISKYGRDAARPHRPAGQQRRVLVTGQVEDDRSVLTGGGGLTNLELLQRARACEPDAHIIYKPHPDVEAGHRVGHVPAEAALALADEIDRTSSITALLDSVDAIHVITSLAGFEALMRGLAVTTHGVPFYAGWGLTHDLGPVPPRRTRRRTLDELVAATLLLYPRYLDPVTRLPCPAEVLVGRMAGDAAQVSSPLVLIRKLQGQLKLCWQSAKLTIGGLSRKDPYR